MLSGLKDKMDDKVDNKEKDQKEENQKEENKKEENQKEENSGSPQRPDVGLCVVGLVLPELGRDVVRGPDLRLRHRPAQTQQHTRHGQLQLCLCVSPQRSSLSSLLS